MDWTHIVMKIKGQYSHLQQHNAQGKKENKIICTGWFYVDKYQIYAKEKLLLKVKMLIMSWGDWLRSIQRVSKLVPMF